MGNNKITRQENGFYANEAKTEWYYSFYGHTGYVRQAIRDTDGVVLGWQNGPANQAGSSNPGVWAFFPAGPDKALADAIEVRYWQLVNDHQQVIKEAKLNPQPKQPKLAPTLRRYKAKVVRRFEVCVMTGKGAKATIDEAYPVLGFTSNMHPKWSKYTKFDAEEDYTDFCKKNGISLYSGTEESPIWRVKVREIK